MSSCELYSLPVRFSVYTLSLYHQRYCFGATCYSCRCNFCQGSSFSNLSNLKKGKTITLWLHYSPPPPQTFSTTLETLKTYDMLQNSKHSWELFFFSPVKWFPPQDKWEHINSNVHVSCTQVERCRLYRHENTVFLYLETINFKPAEGFSPQRWSHDWRLLHPVIVLLFLSVSFFLFFLLWVEGWLRLLWPMNSWEEVWTFPSRCHKEARGVWRCWKTPPYTQFHFCCCCQALSC